MTDSTTTEPRTDIITAAHKRALRHADSIVFRLYKGQATIEANRDAVRSGTGFDEKITIHCGAAHVNDHGPIYVHPDQRYRYSGFEMASSGTFDKSIRTLVDRMRIGGTVALRWTRDNNNDLVRDARLHVDMLHMLIYPPAKDGVQPTHVVKYNVTETVVDSYLVCVRVSKDNSARMVKLDWNGV